MLHHPEAGHLQLGLELGERAAVTHRAGRAGSAVRSASALKTVVVGHAASIGDQMVTCQQEIVESGRCVAARRQEKLETGSAGRAVGDQADTFAVEEHQVPPLDLKGHRLVERLEYWFSWPIRPLGSPHSFCVAAESPMEMVFPCTS